MKRLNQRAFWVLCALFIALVGLVGCGDKGASEAPPIDTSKDVPKRDANEVASQNR
jgi:predicted small lipoprotein YifL